MVSLRSSFLPQGETEDSNQDVDDFFCQESCAVAADNQSSNTVLFFKITEEGEADDDIVVGYGHKVAKGMKLFRCLYLEEDQCVKDGVYYRVNTKKETFFYRKSIVYPFIQFDLRKKGDFLGNKELVEILNYVENNNLKSL